MSGTVLRIQADQEEAAQRDSSEFEPDWEGDSQELEEVAGPDVGLVSRAVWRLPVAVTVMFWPVRQSCRRGYSRRSGSMWLRRKSPVPLWTGLLKYFG